MDVASAELELTSSARGVYVLGGTSASGWLYLTDEDGAVHAVPVRLGGPSMGFMWAFETNYEGKRWHTRTRVWVPEGTQGHQLVGWYGGSSASLAMLFGKRWRTLRNMQGITIEESGPVMGLSMFFGGDMVWLRPIERGELVVAAPEPPSCVVVPEPLPEGIGYVPTEDDHLFWGPMASATIEELDEPLSQLDAHTRLVNEWGRVPFAVGSAGDCHVLVWMDVPSEELTAALGTVTFGGEPLPLPIEHPLEDLLEAPDEPGP